MPAQASARLGAPNLSLAGSLGGLAAALEAAGGLPPVEATVHEDYVSLFVFESRSAATYEKRQEVVRFLAVIFGTADPETVLLRDGRGEHYSAGDGRIPTAPDVSVTVFTSRVVPARGSAA